MLDYVDINIDIFNYLVSIIEQISLPTDMGYAIQTPLINKVFKYKKNNNYKKKRYNKAELYEKMLPSVVIVAVSKR